MCSQVFCSLVSTRQESPLHAVDLVWVDTALTLVSDFWWRLSRPVGTPDVLSLVPGSHGGFTSQGPWVGLPGGSPADFD